MDIPDLVEASLGDEQVRRGVMIGDEDVVCLTPTRTLLYRAEGLLSDESVEEFPHDVERLSISEGRRKTKFALEYVEDSKSLTVPNDIARDVLGLLLEGVLTVERILDDGEEVAGAFRFSELTLVVADRRVVKHVGGAVWEEDFETFDYDDLTGLAFEEASVATEVVLRVDGRPQRIKTPNDQARVVEQTLKQAVFDYFDVATMEELEAKLGTEEEEDEPEPEGNIGLEDDGIDPLVDDDRGVGADPFDASPGDAGVDDTAGGGRSPSDGPGRAMPTGDEPLAPEDDVETENGEPDGSGGAGTGSGDQPGVRTVPESAVTKEDLRAVTEQLSELTEAVNRQNELLRNQNQTLRDHQEHLQSQGKAIKQLIEELRQGR